MRRECVQGPARARPASNAGRPARVVTYGSDIQGGSALLFALLAPVTFALAGAAIDYGRWQNATEQTTAAIDSAVLGAENALRTGSSAAEAEALARKLYQENVKVRIGSVIDTVAFKINLRGTSVIPQGAASLRTPLMKLLFIPSLSIFSAASAQAGDEKPEAEVALILDASDAMCAPCTREDDMKLAAKDLISILMRGNAVGASSAKLAIVPYSADVRPPPSALARAVDPLWPSKRTVAVPLSSLRGGRTPVSSGTLTYWMTPCAGSRVGAAAFTNDAPAAGAYATRVYADRGVCHTPTTATALPLTLDMDKALAAVDALSTGTGRAGQTGLAWGYYALSQEWNDVFAPASGAAPFTARKVRKAAVLLAAGPFDVQYDANGLLTVLPGAGGPANGPSAAAEAASLCAAMKKNGIEIFTIGMATSTNDVAAATLAACASDATGVYMIDTGEQLKEVFRDIAVRLAG